MQSTERRNHWDAVYATKASDAVSWFQPEPTQSLNLLRSFGLTAKSCVIDVGGGDSRLVDYLVREGCTCVAVLDVSDVALSRAQERLGERAAEVQWLVADVTGSWSVTPRDFWHDRAVFHFLTDSADRARYRDRVRHVMKPGGHVVIATFAQDGPEKCSGLTVARYSPETLAHELGSDFRLVGNASESHRTPAGVLQSFVYGAFTFAPEVNHTT